MVYSPLWHPCTQMQQHEQMPPLSIGHAKGAYLYTTAGQPILDAISSWWVNIHGHCHPTINAAISQQLEQLEHVMLAGITHTPIMLLAQRLIDITPPSLTRCFFADSGSAAVEVALKMSLQYWQQQGEHTRKTFISLEQGYHGETLGSLSVTDIPLFTNQYNHLLINHIKAPSPDLSLKEDSESDEEFLLRQYKKLHRLVDKCHASVCAIIVEPLVQGAAGMKMYPAIYLKWLRELADEYNIHLILDEIAVGFGRTGTMFALEQADICPDFLCLSKGLTAGYLPMSCVVTTESIYQAFYSPDIAQGFLHSHSFTGNPLAAAAALASLDIFNNEQTLKHNQLLIKTFAEQLLLLEGHPHIKHIRQTGMIVAFEVVPPKAEAYRQYGKLIAQYAIKHGVLLRPIGHQVYIIPPYCITIEEAKYLLQIARQAVEWAVMQSSDLLTTEWVLP